MRQERFRRLLVITLVSASLVLWLRMAAAHCDTLDGPVVTAAKLALKTGDVTPGTEIGASG